MAIVIRVISAEVLACMRCTSVLSGAGVGEQVGHERGHADDQPGRNRQAHHSLDEPGSGPLVVRGEREDEGGDADREPRRPSRGAAGTDGQWVDVADLRDHSCHADEKGQHHRVHGLGDEQVGDAFDVADDAPALGDDRRADVANRLSSSTIWATALVAGSPDPIDTPMSASFRASTSLTPSPVIATVCPRDCSAPTIARFWSGRTRPKVVDFATVSARASGSSGSERASMGDRRRAVPTTRRPLRRTPHCRRR